jgi:hypothetical protein
VKDLGALGFTPTSGFRTKRHQASLKAQGLTKTTVGSHPAGDSIDFIPPGNMTTTEAIRLVKQKYPGARVAPSNKGAIHITYPGWGNAPDISGSRRRFGD